MAKQKEEEEMHPFKPILNQKFNINKSQNLNERKIEERQNEIMKKKQQNIAKLMLNDDLEKGNFFKPIINQKVKNIKIINFFFSRQK